RAVRRGDAGDRHAERTRPDPRLPGPARGRRPALPALAVDQPEPGDRRPLSRASRTGRQGGAMTRRLVAVGVTVIVTGCGRSSEKSTSAATPVAKTTAVARRVESDDVVTRSRRPSGGRASVIWLGLDGLDWELLDRLVADGRLPNWKRLTAEG